MEEKIIIGTYNVNEEIFRTLCQSFFNTDILIEKIDSVECLNNLDISMSPDLLLLNIAADNVGILDYLKGISDIKKIAIATIGRDTILNDKTYHILYGRPEDISMANNMISVMATTMRKSKNDLIYQRDNEAARNSLWKAKKFNLQRGGRIANVRLASTSDKFDNKLISRDAFVEFMKNTIAFIETKDHYTKRHCERVAKYAAILAAFTDLSIEQKKVLQEACIIHDVGKIAIPHTILTKDSGLTPTEFEEVKQHASVITDLLPEEYFGSIKKIIRSHHEKYNGTGYPDGLAGEEIPLLARMLSVIDSFDAMTTKRGYNEVKTLEEALDEIAKHSGTQFDPAISTTFSYLIENNQELRDYFYSTQDKTEKINVK